MSPATMKGTVIVMDQRTFDSLARALACGVSRRRVLSGLLGSTIAAAFIVPTGHVDAARRGFPGPRWPESPIDPGPCEPFCGVGLCGIPNGCGGTCACSSAESCIGGACAPPCVPSCDACIQDGQAHGCFQFTRVQCADDTDCQAQFGAGLCRPADSGTHYCWVPSHGI